MQDSPVYDTQYQDWTSLTHVCRHWRGVVATYPSLWSTIDAAFMPYTFLKRSLSSPLTLYFGIRNPGFSANFLEAILPHTSRVKQLHISADDWDGSIPLYQMLSSPAPSLSSLTIITDGKDVVNAALPLIFAGEMPNLRHLTLEYFTSWPPSLFQNLTHLCLYDQFDFTRPTTSDFLDFLTSSPLLEDLALVHAGPTRSDSADSPPQPDRRIPLPYLRELNIGDWPAAALIARFLSHLILPPTADMYFWGAPLLGPSEDLAALLPAAPAGLANLHNLRTWYFARQPRVILDVPFVAVRGSTQTLYMYGNFTPAQIAPAVARYPVDAITELGVRDSCVRGARLPRSVWRDMLGRLGQLEKLRIMAFNSPTTTRAVLAALLPLDGDARKATSTAVAAGGDVDSDTDNDQDAGEEGKGVSASPQCPALQSLTIEHDANLPSLFLARVAAQRAATHTPIHTLRVLVHHSHPYNTSLTADGACRHSSLLSTIASDNEGDSASDASDFDVEYHARTGDDLKLLRTHVEDVVFEYRKPLSLDIVPPTWPTRAYEWTRRVHN